MDANIEAIPATEPDWALSHLEDVDRDGFVPPILAYSASDAKAAVGIMRTIRKAARTTAVMSLFTSFSYLLLGNRMPGTRAFGVI